MMRKVLLATLAVAAMGWLGAGGSVPTAGVRTRPLQDVASTMDRAERLLQEGRTGAEVRELQGQALRRLDALIARLQEQPGRPGRRPMQGRIRPSQQMKAGPGLGRQPLRAAPESILPPTGLPPEDVPGAEELAGRWAPGLPPEEARAVADTFRTGRLPARYLELLRRYNRRLAETPEGE